MIPVTLRRSLLSFALLTGALNSPALAWYKGSPGNQVQVTRTEANSHGANVQSPYGYNEYLPPNYSTSSAAGRYPVVLNLHGMGQLGPSETLSDVAVVKSQGLAARINAGEDFEGLVFTPRTKDWWSATMIDQFVEYVYASYPNADRDRLYVVGLSMGGDGVWKYATQYSDKVAAIVPVCGATSPSSARSILYGKMGVWATHNVNDSQVVFSQTWKNLNYLLPGTGDIMTGYGYTYLNNGSNPPAGSDRFATYRASDGTHQWRNGVSIADTTHTYPVRLTVYADGSDTKNHNAWTRTFANNHIISPYGAAAKGWLWTWTKASPSPSPSATPVPTVTPTPTPVPLKAIVDFGSALNSTVAGWNSAAALVSSGSLTVKAESGATIGTLSTVARFNSVNTDGTTTPSSTIGLPIEATRDSFYGNTAPFNGYSANNAVLQLSGLNPARSYTLSFFASRLSTDGANRTTVYTVAGATTSTVRLNATNNSSILATTAALKPNSSGVIRITVTKGTENTTNSGFYYLGSLKLLVQ